MSSGPDFRSYLTQLIAQMAFHADCLPVPLQVNTCRTNDVIDYVVASARWCTESFGEPLFDLRTD